MVKVEHPIGEFPYPRIVGYHYQGVAFSMKTAEQLKRDLLVEKIKVSCGFVR